MTMAITDEVLNELLKDYQKPEDLLGQNGLLKQLQKRLLEKAMGAELTVHLGYGKHDPAGRNSGWPEGGLGWLRPGFQGSRFRVQGSKFGVCHKHPEYNPPLPPPSAWTGRGLVPPWTYPGTIDPAPAPLLDQAHLSNAVSSGVSALSPYSALDVVCWMLEVRCSGSKFASGAPHPAKRFAGRLWWF